VTLNWSLGGEKIFAEKLKEILTRKEKEQPAGDRKTIMDKLEKHERLTDGEFWSVYESIHKEGPEVKYSYPNNWTNYSEQESN